MAVGARQWDVQPPSMQCAAYNKLGTGVHGLSHVVVGHIGLVVHNNAQHDMQGLTGDVACIIACGAE